MPEATATAIPNGAEVVQPGISGLGDFFRQLGGIAIGGIATRVDMELTKDAAQLNPDYYAPPPKVQPPQPFQYGAGDQLRDVVANLAPWQWAGLAVAAGLAYGLATKRF